MLEKGKNSPGFIIFSVFCALLTLAGIISLFGSWYTIDQSERGVITRFGKVTHIAEPGLGFKAPLISDVTKVSIANLSVTHDEIQAYSKDQQPAKMKVSVGFHVPPDEIEALYTKYGNIQVMADRLVNRHIPTQVENVFGQYNAVSAVQHREEFVKKVTNELKKALGNEPLVVDSVNIENISFTDEYEKNIEERMKAEVNVAKTQQMLQTETINADIAIQKARGMAESQLSMAHAEAEGIKLRGAAEAEAIKLRADALSKNPLLIELITAERWNGELPQTMLPNSSVPFINTKNNDH
ncbi:Band 7 protein [Chania multitudinisentens RB-25]|uniref:Band 7 protein n=1 Tax=Chania multitudinisentens RB-25 TaxID=1441930 RepID=W0L888_9GAMM|nr:prohibitin family protein [Chania multitudinisentens]AHG18225.1 Band 7 protein [Chania multitudinisentens RB-25]